MPNNVINFPLPSIAQDCHLAKSLKPWLQVKPTNSGRSTAPGPDFMEREIYIMWLVYKGENVTRLASTAAVAEEMLERYLNVGAEFVGLKMDTVRIERLAGLGDMK